MSPAVEKVIDGLLPTFKDVDLTIVRWHKADDDAKSTGNMQRWDGAQSFFVTGDINALWLRDSTNQLAPYQGLAASAVEIGDLNRGAIGA